MNRILMYIGITGAFFFMWGCSSSTAPNESNTPTILVRGDTFYPQDTLRVEIINTTDTSLYVYFQEVYYDVHINGEWVEEFIHGKPFAGIQRPWFLVEQNESLVDVVILEYYSYREGEYSARFRYRGNHNEDWVYHRSGKFQLLH